MIRRTTGGFTTWFGIYEDKQKIGSFMLSNYDIHEKDKPVEFWNFFINSEFRGKGYGKKALADLIKRLKKEKKERLWLYVDKGNDKSLHIYNSANFKVISEKPSTISMELNLTV